MGPPLLGVYSTRFLKVMIKERNLSSDALYIF